MRRQSKAIASQIQLPRRQALLWAGGALLALAGSALLARKAAAITLVEADAEIQALFHSACGPVAYHQKLAAEARAALLGLGGNKVGPVAQPAALDCPICGCKVQLDDKKVDQPR